MTLQEFDSRYPECLGARRLFRYFLTCEQNNVPVASLDLAGEQYPPTSGSASAQFVQQIEGMAENVDWLDRFDDECKRAEDVYSHFHNPLP